MKVKNNKILFKGVTIAFFIYNVAVSVIIDIDFIITSNIF